VLLEVSVTIWLPPVPTVVALLAPVDTTPPFAELVPPFAELVPPFAVLDEVPPEVDVEVPPMPKLVVVELALAVVPPEELTTVVTFARALAAVAVPPFPVASLELCAAERPPFPLVPAPLVPPVASSVVLLVPPFALSTTVIPQSQVPQRKPLLSQD